jgi:hypothetical protein
MIWIIRFRLRRICIIDMFIYTFGLEKFIKLWKLRFVYFHNFFSFFRKIHFFFWLLLGHILRVGIFLYHFQYFLLSVEIILIHVWSYILPIIRRFYFIVRFIHTSTWALLRRLNTGISHHDCRYFDVRNITSRALENIWLGILSG